MRVNFPYDLIIFWLLFASNPARSLGEISVVGSKLHLGRLRKHNETSRYLLTRLKKQFLTVLLLEPPGIRAFEIRHTLEKAVSDLPYGCAHLEAMDISSRKGRSLSLMLFGSLRTGLTLLRRGRLITGVNSNTLDHLLGRAWQECHGTYWNLASIVFFRSAVYFFRGFSVALRRHLESLPWENLGENTSRARPLFLGGYLAPHSGWARAGVRSSTFSSAWTDIHSYFHRVIIVTDAFRIRLSKVPRRARGKIAVISIKGLYALRAEILKSSWFILCPMSLSALAEAARVLSTSQATFDVAITRANEKRARPLHAPSKPRPGRPARVSWILWLHVPKTGTSFAHTVYRYACKQWSTSKFMKLPNASKPEHFDNELSWSADLNCIPGLPEIDTTINRLAVPGLAPGQHNHRGQVIYRLREFPGRAVTMLRRPVSRIKSAFRSLLGHGVAAELYLCGSCGHSFDGTVPLQMALAESILRGQLGLVEFAQLEHTRSCYAKILLGTTCLPSNAAELATKRLREDFIFVGLAEQWELSVCLFHAMLDGEQPDTIEFHNSRPSPISKTFPMDARDITLDDQIDEAIYMEAVSMFEQNVVAFFKEIQELGPLCAQSLLHHRR